MSAQPKPGSAPLYPRLPERKAAHYLRLNAQQQARLLKEYKYPKNTPQVFYPHYYTQARSGIREVIKRGFPGLIDAKAKVSSIAKPVPRRNNLRLLEAFANSQHAVRKLRIITAHRYQAHVRNVELRLSPQVVALEGDEVRYIYYNEKAKKLDPEEARLTLEFGFWILNENGVDVRPEQLEYLDLFAGPHYRGDLPRKETIQTLQEMARLIEGQWETI